MNNSKRKLPPVALAALATFAAFAASGDPANAQEFPSVRPVTMIVPYAAGGPGDQIARVIQNEMAQRLGQSVVIELKPGAGGNIGAEHVAKIARPDGYTILKTATSLASNPILQKKFPFDPLVDLVAIGGVNIIPMSVIVHPSVPANDLQAFIAWAKKKGNGVTYGSAGPGTTTHLAGVLFADVTGIEVTHIPFKGVAPAQVALLGGQLEAMFDFASTMIPHVKAGKLRGLAVASSARVASMPDVPTAKEQGIPYEFAGWFGMFAPRATPPAVVAKLNDALNFALNHPDVKKRFADRGEIVTPGTPDEFAKYFGSQIEVWRKLLASGRLQHLD